MLFKGVLYTFIVCLVIILHHNIDSTVSDSMVMHVMLFESVSLAVVIVSSLVLVKLQVCHILHTHAERVEIQEFSLFTHTLSSQSERRRETGGNEERTAESSTSCQTACLLAINRHIQACCWVWVNMSTPKAFPSQKHSWWALRGITHWRDERSNAIHLINNNWETQSNKTIDRQCWADYLQTVRCYWLHDEHCSRYVIRKNHFRW